ncbi:MAG: rRNA maturation RNase YbeY [Firmicutes bacterium]|nr:rRNA maturation RNase YbeY [Bacillota bacterium]MCL2771467.1 rRNA maturation RNase YbeY [Bacillota bacterium]
MKLNFFGEEEFSTHFGQELVFKKFEKSVAKMFDATLKILEQNRKLFTVSVNFVSENEIKELNRVHRKKDVSTDVLSFPNLNIKFENIDDIIMLRKITKEDFKIDLCLKTKTLNLGDIYLSPAYVMKQAVELGNTLDREVKYLLLHGFLHLFGFDHECEDDKVIMRGFEEMVLPQKMEVEDSVEVYDDSPLIIEKTAEELLAEETVGVAPKRDPKLKTKTKKAK